METLNMNIERTQTPPFYRLSQVRKTPAITNTTDDEKMVCQEPDVQLQKGVLHTKRHSANEDLHNERWAVRIGKACVSLTFHLGSSIWTLV